MNMEQKKALNSLKETFTSIIINRMLARTSITPWKSQSNSRLQSNNPHMVYGIKK